MFVVIFNRSDEKPDEEYCYYKREDAEYHLGLFLDDDSDIYSKISIVEVDENQEIRYNTLNSDAMR